MKIVLIGMSGGIDSSVAAFLLKNQGYEVIGLTLKHLNDEIANLGHKSCCSFDDIQDAKIVAYEIGIPHYVIDISSEFEKEVIQPFINSYNKGITPSPCIICDEKIKMKKLYDFAVQIGVDFVSTGHYIKKDEEGNLILDNENPKDQSYMLYRLEPQMLKKFLFPLANLTKYEVREIARKNNIYTHNKKDSQGICFAPKGYIEFLKENLKEDIKEGNFVDEEGNFIAKHQGYQLYTIGQRRGLGLNLGKAFFVKEIIPSKNEIILSDFESILVDEICLINTKFYKPIKELLDKRLFVKPRFSSKGLFAKIEIRNDEIYIVYENRNCENSRGQHLVIYLDKKIVGGGEIK